jgi:hypothetical protein
MKIPVFTARKNRNPERVLTFSVIILSTLIVTFIGSGIYVVVSTFFQ